MNRIYTLCFASLMLTALSCNKSGVDNRPDTRPAPEEEEVFPKIEITVSGPTGKINKPVKQGNGDYNFLGYGYDITGKYADTASVRTMAFDVAALAKAFPDRVVNMFNSAGGTGEAIAGMNAADLAAQISDRLNTTVNSKSFRKSVTAFFPDQSALSTKYVYGDFVQLFQFRVLRFSWDPRNMDNYLSTEFKNDIQLLSSADLVKKYGTHILNGISLGAKVHGVYQAISDAKNRKRSAEAGAEVAFRSVLGYTWGFGPVVLASEYKSLSAAKLVYEVVGGDLSAIKENKTNPVSVNITDWLKTVKREEAMFVDINRNGLIPIYELISDENKKLSIKAYVEQYIKEQEVKLID
ncbi:hypothetical protein HHL16_23555 [Pseudoflavitalea sp. G-6-1-2]|uniref:MAC/perforin domain-containing protein n=1 Tax=Pseudoflavitalea sp. G-6-1-2 TaxID=2728841 RepID=UPI00146AC0B1|nr:MAC/perforin domain-containing protein [Pseudoflavitalea sp. G-6-1-2]NML23877.1 hypothetical protein [Pseudoflavitalea sp. G-6-1-2]